jgi:Na+-transporting methylmalonyl-CoA/oxaloacetate decarboxylase gamma subunit
MTLEFAESAILALLVIGCVLLFLVIMAAPIEAAARRSPAFADRLDRFIDRIFD